MSKPPQFLYSKSPDAEKRYHIFVAPQKISLCKKIKNVIVQTDKHDDDDLCLDCYGAQIDWEETLDNENPLEKIFISSRKDNITQIEDFPKLSDLQHQQEIELEASQSNAVSSVLSRLVKKIFYGGSFLRINGIWRRRRNYFIVYVIE